MKYLNNKYDFLLEREFMDILGYNINENDNNGKWTNNNTYEWDIKSEKRLKNILSKLDKKSIIKYFEKFIKFISNLPKGTKRRILLPVILIFLSFVSIKDIKEANLDIDNNLKLEINNEIEKATLKDIKDKSDINKTTTPTEFHKAQEIVKSAEGGYTDDSDDKGNWVDGKLIGTNHGISAPELKSYLGRTPNKKEMEELNYKTAENIYKKKYWKRNNLDLLNNQKVANIIYDAVVNQGRRGAKLVIQKSLQDFDLDIKMRNIFKPETIEKINKLDQEKLLDKIYDYRWERYKSTKKFYKYGDGWKNRLDKFK